LRGLNKDFYHKTVKTQDVEDYFSKQSGKDQSKVFDQYLRTVKIPVLEYKIQGDNISYRWANCVDGFNMPVQLEKSALWFYPTTEWKQTTGTAELINDFKVNQNMYVTVKKVL